MNNQDLSQRLTSKNNYIHINIIVAPFWISFWMIICKYSFNILPSCYENWKVVLLILVPPMTYHFHRSLMILIPNVGCSFKKKLLYHTKPQNILLLGILMIIQDWIRCYSHFLTWYTPNWIGFYHTAIYLHSCFIFMTKQFVIECHLATLIVW